MQIGESEKVAENSRSRCKEQDIPFYRFNPKLNDIIPAGETDNLKLMDMVLETKIQIKEQRLKEMTELLQMITVSSSDVSVEQTAPPRRVEDTSSSLEEKEESRVDTKQKLQGFQVPQVSITIEDDQEEEDSNSQLNEQFNEALNRSMIHPTDDSTVATNSVESDDFTETGDQKELEEQLLHNHYQLDMDSQEHQPHRPRDSCLVETAAVFKQ